MNIEWNRVTWYSKLVAVIVFVAVAVLAFWFGLQYGQALGILRANNDTASSSQIDVSTSATNTGSNSYYENVSEWQTDQRNDAGFSIAYPIDFTVDDDYSLSTTMNWRLDSGSTPGVLAFTLTIPSAFEPQTNFADATLGVGWSDNSVAVAQCLTPDASGGPMVATSTAVINGISLTVFHSSDAGAGNIYETTSYRTVRDGKCYAIEYTIHSSQIANYPASYNLQPFNEKMLTDVLDRIVGTFTFE